MTPVTFPASAVLRQAYVPAFCPAGARGQPCFSVACSHTQYAMLCRRLDSILMPACLGQEHQQVFDKCLLTELLPIIPCTCASEPTGPHSQTGFRLARPPLMFPLTAGLPAGSHRAAPGAGRPQRLGLPGLRRGACHEYWLHIRPALALGLPGPHLAAVLWDLRCHP